MKYLTLGATLVTVSLLFAGCQQTSSANTPAQQSQDKAPNTTLVGTLTKSGSHYILKGSDGKTSEINSYTVTLDSYVGKSITITGQYSGTTLFVDTISTN